MHVNSPDSQGLQKESVYIRVEASQTVRLLNLCAALAGSKAATSTTNRHPTVAHSAVIRCGKKKNGDVSTPSLLPVEQEL